MVNKFSEILLILGIVLSVTEVKADKRLVLHSADDVLNKLSSLEQEILGMKTEIQGMRTELTAKDQTIASLQQSISQKADIGALGSTYVRWGRTTCDGNSSQLVYKGFAAGPFLSEPGNGANMLCLPDHPTWAQSQPSYNGAHINGAEYDPGFNAFNFQNWEDMPCSVCRTHLSSTIMMPASTQCSAGWTMQYTGYLASDRHDLSRSEYICVDGHPEALYHGEADLASPEFFGVQAKCGVLPCQVYPDGKQLACSVCSK